eukprot:gene1195-2323_t
MKLFTLIIIFYCGIYVSAFNPPKFVHSGLIGPKFTQEGEANIAGRHAIAAAIMAIREINNKTDGMFDEILPQTILKLAFRAPRQSFLEAVAAALYLSGSAFNGTGVLGVIGTSSTDSSKATAEVFANTPYNVPQIAYGAESSDLGHSIYSHFTRVCPSDAYEGRIIARLVKKYFGWATVTIFASGDTFGNDITLEFETEAALLGGITIESRYTFWSGITDFSGIIQNAMDRGGVLKIFLLFMKSQDTGILMEQGYKMGLFKVGTQIIGTEYMISTDTIKAMSPDTDAGSVMKGAIAVMTTLTKKRKEPIFTNFVKRFRSQKRTMGTNVDGSTFCDRSKDDDHKEYLYMGHPDGLQSSPLVCAGIDFKALAKDGSDIDNSALFAYDATIALAHALHEVFYVDQVQNITGDILRDAIVYNVTFNGLSGHVTFNTGGPGFEKYGLGDRLGGNDFVVYNFDPRAYHALVDYGAGAWFEVGVYTSKKTFVPCDMRTDSKCSDWVFNTKDNSSPVDEAPVEEVQMDTMTRAGLQVGGAIALAMVVIYAIIIKLCEDTRLIKASQPVMMRIVLLGAALACIRVLLATVDITNSICIAGKWLGHLSFGLVFGALVMKIWRVDAVVNSGFRKVKITARQVELMLLGCLGLFCAYLTADTLYSQPHMSYDESFNGHTNIRLMKCTNTNQTMTVVLYVIEAALLVAGARLCWSTKDVPDAINDSRYIAMSMYLIVFVCSVTFPIVYFQIDPTPALLLMVMAVGFIVATVGCITMLFGPKTKLLWDGADVDENFAIVRKSSIHGAQNNLVAWKKKISSATSSNQKKSTVLQKKESCNSLNVPEYHAGKKESTSSEVSITRRGLHAIGHAMHSTHVVGVIPEENIPGEERFHSEPRFPDPHPHPVIGDAHATANGNGTATGTPDGSQKGSTYVDLSPIHEHKRKHPDPPAIIPLPLLVPVGVGLGVVKREGEGEGGLHSLDVLREQNEE